MQSSHVANVRLATLLHLWFQFLQSSSLIMTLLHSWFQFLQSSSLIMTLLHSWFQFLQSSSLIMTLLHLWFQFLVFQPDHDLAALVISTSTVFPIHQVVCDSILCYDWYTLLGVGNKLFYGHAPDSFPQYGMGSGHARLDQDLVNHSQKQSG